MSNSRSNPIRWWDAASALLLMAAMLISASRLVATDWTGHLSIVQTLAFFGVIAGFLLGLSRFSPRTTVIFAFIYGLFAIPWQLGLTLPAAYSWSERIIILMNRLQIILSQLAYREPVSDSLLFLIIFFLLFWVIAVFSSYILVRRGDPWLAILPGGLALFIIHSFDSAVADRVWYLAAYLFFALILVARMTFNHRQSRWREIRTTLPPHISLDFVRYTIFIVFVIVILAWTAPAMANALPEARRAWRPVQDAWNETINNFENAFASLKATIFSYTTVYSSTSTLGRGAQLSDNQIFHAFAPITTPPEVRLYWRARVFDSYQHGIWRSTMENSQPFDPATGEMPVETGVQRWLAQYYIFSAANLTTLFMPSQPLWVSRAGDLEYGENPDGTIDFVTYLAAAPVGPGERYDVLTSVSAAPVEMLRRSGSDYPAWIRDRYLQLPDSITPRTIALAEQITAGLDTPYDKAAAITRYLRENIRYVPFLAEAPPARVEPIDWFLFESKSGFCNYYASAQVILLRSLGIPARYAVGFAQGEQVVENEGNKPPEAKVFIVRQRDSHAWPEVYFPDLGWVEFEPTASQPEIARQQNQRRCCIE